MAKKTRSLNPADAFRKAQRQKEIKRNKLDRKNAREGAQNKKDTSVIQAEINQLERVSKRTPSEETRLKDLKNELSQISKANEQKGVTSSGDTSRPGPSTKVFIDPATGLPATSGHHRNETEHNNANASKPSSKSASNSRKMNWFGPDGKLLEPERSFYYDPVFNPFGVPPPGMPVRMKDNYDVPPTSHPVGGDSSTEPGRNDIQLADKQDDPDHPSNENDSESEEDDEEEDTENEEDDIPLPQGSPPRDKSDSDSDDDDIPLPEGPPPPKAAEKLYPEPLINRAQSVTTNVRHQAPLPHPGFTQPPPFFPPPISLVPGVPPPPIIGGLSAIPFPLGPNGLPLPPPPIHNFHPLPPPPPSAKLPAKPEANLSQYKTLPNPSVTSNPKPTTQASATVTGLPQLRDLKREATSFVPAAIRKKRKELDRRAGLAGLGDSHRIQAAPESFNDHDSNHLHQNETLSSTLDSDSSSNHPKHLTTSLLAALQRDGILSDSSTSKPLLGQAAAEKDDYDKFVESLGDVL